MFIAHPGDLTVSLLSSHEVLCVVARGAVRSHTAWHVPPIAADRAGRWYSPVSVSLSKFKVKSSVLDYHGVDTPAVENFLISF